MAAKMFAAIFCVAWYAERPDNGFLLASDGRHGDCRCNG
jgi:hypothetical protein